VLILGLFGQVVEPVVETVHAAVGSVDLEGAVGVDEQLGAAWGVGRFGGVVALGVDADARVGLAEPFGAAVGADQQGGGEARRSEGAPLGRSVPDAVPEREVQVGVVVHLK